MKARFIKKKDKARSIGGPGGEFPQPGCVVVNEQPMLAPFNAVADNMRDKFTLFK